MSWLIVTLFWVCVGIIIGWNLPQPPWARRMQRKIVDTFSGIVQGPRQ
jgi:type III secretory pathway component EscT